MTSCTAPWYELNLSAPDDNASACCYYAGERETFDGGNVSLDHYWNGPNMKALRRLQFEPSPPQPNGCSNCFFFQNKHNAATTNYFDFTQQFPDDISDAQRANWLLAKQEHQAFVEHVSAVPLRLYANFGYTCNLSCKMCHQVPRRRAIDKFITCEALYAWREEMKKMMEVCVIGGEPFAMPEAIKFMRKFAVDDELDAVRLSVFTNGTVHHKHFETLRNKRKLGVCISLDSISSGYENIRVGSKWDIVERNVLMIREAIAKDRPEWILNTNGIIMKTGVPHLAEFARWHIEHDINTQFLDFINFRGTEDAYFSENIINQPHLLDEVPGWEDDFAEAIEIFDKGGKSNAADSLRHFHTRVVEARAANADTLQQARQIRFRNDWWEGIEVEQADMLDAMTYHRDKTDGAPALVETDAGLAFKELRHGDALISQWVEIESEQEGKYKLTVEWAFVTGEDRHTHVVAQSKYHDLEGFREYSETKNSTIVTITGAIPAGSEIIRVIVYPTGEDRSFVPKRFKLEIDGQTNRRLPSPAPQDEPAMDFVVDAAVIQAAVQHQEPVSETFAAVGQAVVQSNRAPAGGRIDRAVPASDATSSEGGLRQRIRRLMGF